MDTHRRSIIEIVDRGKLVRAQALDDAAEEGADGLLGVVADVVHVALHRRQAIVGDDWAKSVLRNKRGEVCSLA